MMIVGADSLLSLVKELCAARPIVVALVGGGGKTSAMFALARAGAASGMKTLTGTTTRIMDPAAASEREGRGFAPVLGSRVEGGKLMGVSPEEADRAALSFDLAIFEADGSRGRPIKAPADHEPVVPESANVVIGVVGLDAVGASMDERMVHRPELFGPLVGCALGETITTSHIARLAESPSGLFKGVPDGASRILLLNKADLVEASLAEFCALALRSAKVADAVILCALGVEAGATGGSA
jgi:hypothetical protein